MIESNVNVLWVLVCTGLVFSMQGGFLCLESGLTRSKNAINVAIKNLTDFSVSLLLFWAFGFGLMFGETHGGWIGWSDFLPSIGHTASSSASFFIFQAMFCATAATIVSGAVAGRMRFSAYIVVTLVVTALIYPLIGHWVWGGALTGDSGWLARIGFVDFAGSTVVHCVGGFAALAAAVVIGPRLGRFRKDNTANRIPASNLPMAMLGTLLLCQGWIGFNGGSTLAINGQVPGIICNTLLAGTAGMVTALGISSLKKYADAVMLMNGTLAGLVAITAGCHAVTAPSAILIGSVGAAIMFVAQRILDRCRIDDAIGAFPVHGAAGAWGTVATGLLGSPEILATGLSKWAQIGVQVIGVVVASLIAFGLTFILLKVINRFHALRVAKEQEHLGLNVAEHGATTETFELLSQMVSQERSGDFSHRMIVDPFSEIGQIALQHNRVLDRVVDDTAKVTQIAEEARDARAHAEATTQIQIEQSEQLLVANQALEQEIEDRKQAEQERDALQNGLLDMSRRAGMADMATGVLHNVGNVLNSVNVSVNCMTGRLRDSKVTGLVRAIDLIADHKNDLGNFFSSDERGQRLPGYLSKLATLISNEGSELNRELTDLSEHVEHIKEIVAMQQSFGRLSGVTQELDPIDIVEDAIKINFAGLERHGAELIREFDDVPRFATDKHRVLQILVNIIGNAKHAIETSKCKQITVRVTGSEDQIHYEVKDTGVGVDAENLTRVFNHGFTTKKDGHGYGLHSSALAAKELGGSLSGDSDGLGKGALFTLRVPINLTSESRAELSQCRN